LAHKQADSADTVQIQDDVAEQERIKVRVDALRLSFIITLEFLQELEELRHKQQQQLERLQVCLKLLFVYKSTSNWIISERHCCAR
jgi:hypothetical protein